MDIILKPFSWLLTFFYQFAGYGVALILFGFVVKLILFLAVSAAFRARHFTSSMVRSHTLVPVGPVTIRPSVWRRRL